MAAGDELALSEHAARTREMWNKDAPDWVASGRAAWARRSPDWGMWGVPEDELHILPDVRGLDVIDLGCGTGYWCAWFARLGASPVGLDVSEAQLETARTLQREHGLDFPLVHATAENPPFEDGSFDLAFSEYGAAIWCDPYVWIPRAYRLLRPGGRLIFLRNSTLAILCATDTGTSETLQLPQFRDRRYDWPDEPGVEFHLAHGEWIDLLRANGFEIERLVEIQAPEDAETHTYYSYMPAEWAKKWPSEEIWVARLPRR
jgi:SAM-dependent methyltransferase